MVTTIDVKNYISTEDYLNLLDKTVCLLSFPLREGNIPSQVFNIDAGCLNKAGISLSELNELYGDDDKIIKFIELHQNEIQDDDDDYYKDNDEDKNETIEVLPSYKNFLIGYLIKYYLLKNNPKGLDVYLKALRIPNHKKYAVELKNIYNRL